MMSSKKRPTESAWDSDDDLLQDDLPGINAFPKTKNEEDELDEDALLGLDSEDEESGLSKQEISITATEDNTLGNSLVDEEALEIDTEGDELEGVEDAIDIGVNADEDIDELAVDDEVAVDEELNAEYQVEEAEQVDEAQVEEEEEEESHRIVEMANSTSFETVDHGDGVEEIMSTSQEEENLSTNREESESDSESEDEEKGRGRFKSERVTVSTASVSKTRTDIPDTLEISEEQQHEIEQFLSSKQNQRFGRRGGRGQRGQQHMGRIPSRGGHVNTVQQFQQMSGGPFNPPPQSVPQPLIPVHTGQQPPVKMRKIHVNPHFKGHTTHVTSVSWPTQVSTAVSWAGRQNIAGTNNVHQPNNLPPPTSQVPEAWPRNSQHVVSQGQYPPHLMSISPTTQPYQGQAPYTSQYQQVPPPRQVGPFSPRGPPVQTYPPAQPQQRPPNTVAPSQPQQPIPGSPYPPRLLGPQRPPPPSPGIGSGPRPLMQQPMYPPHSAPAGQSPFHPRPTQQAPSMPPRPMNSGPRFQTPMSPPSQMQHRPPFEQHRMPNMQGSQRPPHHYEPNHLRPVQQVPQFQQRPGFQQPRHPPPPLQQQQQQPLPQPGLPAQKDYPPEHFQQQENQNQNQYSDVQNENQFGNQSLNRIENKKVYPVVKKAPVTRQTVNFRQTTNPNLKVLSSPTAPQRIVSKKRPSTNETLISPSKIAKKEEPKVPLDEDAARLQTLLEEQKRKREMIQKQKELRRQQQAEQRRLELVKKLADQGKSIEDIAGPVETMESDLVTSTTKGQQIQTISRHGITTKTQVQAGRGRGMKSPVRNIKSSVRTQGAFTQIQVQSEVNPNEIPIQSLGNKTNVTQTPQAVAGRGRGMKSQPRGRGSFGQARGKPIQQQLQPLGLNKNNSNAQNENVQKQWGSGEQQKGVQNQTQQRRLSDHRQPGVNVSQQNVVKNIVLQDSEQAQNSKNLQLQEMGKQNVEGNASQQFSGRGHSFRGRAGIRGVNPGINRGMSRGMDRGMNQGMNSGLHRGINRGMNRGINQGMNRGMYPGMNRGMNPGLNQGMNTRMNQGINRGMMNHGMNRGMMNNRGMNSGMMNRGMSRGNFRGRGRGGVNQQGFMNPGQPGNTALKPPALNVGMQQSIPAGVVQPQVNTPPQGSPQQTEQSSRTVVTSPIQTRTVVKQSPKAVKTIVSSRTVVSKQQGAGRGRGPANATRRVVSQKTGPTLVSIDNLSASTSEEDVRKLCRSVGEPESIAMIRSQKKAMVKFSNPVHAAGFTNKYNRYMLDLSHITVRTLAS